MQGSFLVECIPLLQYVVASVPDAGFRNLKKFARWRRLATEPLEKPLAEAKRPWARYSGLQNKGRLRTKLVQVGYVADAEKARDA